MFYYKISILKKNNDIYSLRSNRYLVSVIGNKREGDLYITSDVNIVGVWSVIKKDGIHGLIMYSDPFKTKVDFLYGGDNFFRSDILAITTYRRNQVYKYEPEYVSTNTLKISNGNKYLGFINRLRILLEGIIYKNLPEPEASLLVGILIGGNRFFPKELNQAFRDTGTSHIVSASGYNLTILLIGLGTLLKRVNKYVKLISFIFFIFIFIVVAGFAIPILRAGIMTVLIIVSTLLGQRADTSVVLFLSVFILALFSPDSIRTVSFQLSFLATLGLIYLYPVFKFSSIHIKNLFFPRIKIMSFVKSLYYDYFLTTLSCTMATLPISMFYFQNVPLISVLVNILVLPVLEDVSLWGIIGMFSAAFFPNGKNPFFLVSWTLLHYFQKVILFFSHLNITHLQFSLFGIVLYSTVLFFFVLIIYPLTDDGEDFYSQLFQK